MESLRTMRLSGCLITTLLLAATAVLQAGCIAGDITQPPLPDVLGPFEAGAGLNDALQAQYQAFERSEEYRGVRFAALLPDGQTQLEILLTPSRLKDSDFSAVLVQGGVESQISTSASFFEGAIETTALNGVLPAPEDFARFALRRDAAGNCLLEGALAGDAELLAQQGGNPTVAADYLLSRFHLVTGFYWAQFRVTLQVPQVVLAGDPGAISPSNTPATVLNDLSTWGNSRFAAETHIALVHLFTGRGLEGSTLGIARINALCGASRVGLTRNITPWPFGMASIAAHELGHNFAMRHDSRCTDSPETQFLMCPYSTQTSAGISQPSRLSAEQAILTAVQSGCFAPVE